MNILRLSSRESPDLDFPKGDCGANSSSPNLIDEVVTGRFLLLEIGNLAFTGPDLQLFPNPDPGDGWFGVVGIQGEQRNQWQVPSTLQKKTTGD